MRRSPSPRLGLLLGLSATLVTLSACSAAAQNTRTTPKADKAEKTDKRSDDDDRSNRRRQIHRFGADVDDDRAVIGLTTASNAGKRDTLGVMVQSITPGGPAEKAGIEEGDRIASINGVSLRLSPEDAGEPDVGGMMGHRLRREMRKVKPGQTVELGIHSSGQSRTVRVPTVAAESLSSRRVRLDRDAYEDRAVLGLNVSASGSRRDTLGALVTAVATDGPAEKAGIVEGDRIAAINGVDLRVAREDAGDRWASGVKMSRFQRELRKVKSGEAVELRVVTGGQARSVRVTAAKARDVYKDRAQGGSFFFDGDGFAFDGGEGFDLPRVRVLPNIAPMAPMPPMPPMPPMRMDGEDVMMLRDLGRQFRERAGERTRDLRIDRDGDRLTIQRVTPRGGRMNATIAGESGTVALSGLRLTRVNSDLASYFGKESEGGLLVTSREGGQWRALREGDVILSVNGTAVRQGDRTRISLDSGERSELEVLRKGKRERIVIEGDR